MKNFISSFWNLFTSLKLALWLILALLIGVFSGMFYDQTKPLAEHVEKLDASWFKPILLFFELNDAYHSWWFSILMLLLAQNLIACSIKRLPAIWIQIHNPKRIIEKNTLLKTKGHIHLKNLNAEQVQRVLRIAMPAHATIIPMQTQSQERSNVILTKVRISRTIGSPNDDAIPTKARVDDSLDFRASEDSIAANANNFDDSDFHQNDIRLDSRFHGNDSQYFFAERHRYNRLGVYVIHTALLFIFFGSIVSSNLGIEATIAIEEKKVADSVFAKGPGGLLYNYTLPNFSVQCDEFRIKKFIDNSPMEYESDLSIIKDGKVLLSKTIRVNDPLTYDGFTFYQASYQELNTAPALQLKINRGQNSEKIRLAFNKNHSIDESVSIKALDYLENFAGLGPALQLELTQNKQSTSFFIFRRYPDFDAQVRDKQLNFVLEDIYGNYATGLSIRKSPWLSVAFAGFFLFVVGLFMAFILNHRHYYAYVENLGDNCFELILFAHSRRRKLDFDEKWQRLGEALKIMVNKRMS